MALIRTAKAVETLIDKYDKSQLAEIVGAKIILEGLYAPLKQIAENAGYNGAVVLNKVKEGENDFGFNAATGQFENLLKSGVIDPAKVTRLALQNAVSIASLLLITEAVVAELPEEKKDKAMGRPPMGMGEDY